MGFFFTQRSNLSLTILFFIFLSWASLSTPKPSAYEILEDYNFPIGLLPRGVIDYDLDSSIGKFSAFRNGSCSFFLDGSYQLKYKSTIKGYISQDAVQYHERMHCFYEELHAMKSPKL
ncbi:DUF538 domain-containing protein [Quillaja saponaria]|uniref:DUF538 domain-containing protein n=1 Tax=Quillaja saponaria TaxID=32244 RepID=A0AAD7VJE4_QUISA|nr:DUF538 domain-containing protein [Quillaja saponaria]